MNFSKGTTSFLAINLLLLCLLVNYSLGKECPDKKSYCDDDATCCKLATGEYGCCPLPEATCCSDGEHCCPHGYTCDLSHGKCVRGNSSLDLVRKQSSRKLNFQWCIYDQVYCPDGYHCCPDLAHCCPYGYHCDSSCTYCYPDASSLKLLPQLLRKKDSTEAINNKL